MLIGTIRVSKGSRNSLQIHCFFPASDVAGPEVIVNGRLMTYPQSSLFIPCLEKKFAIFGQKLEDFHENRRNSLSFSLFARYPHHVNMQDDGLCSKRDD